MKAWVIILTTGFFTYLMRYLPMNSEFIRNHPILKSQAFAMLPFCILAALVGPTFFPIIRNTTTALPIALVVGGITTAFITKKTQSLLWGALSGYALFVTLDFLLHNPVT